jgi:hypothetical protein
MSELTPIPTEHRKVYYEALRAGLAEAERRGLELDALPFAAFHRALHGPMVELIEAATRRQVADELRAESIRCRVEYPDARDAAKALLGASLFVLGGGAIARGRGEP